LFCLNSLGKSIDNNLNQNYQSLEYESPPSTQPKFLSRGQSYRAVIGDTITLPCATQDLGEKKSTIETHVFETYLNSTRDFFLQSIYTSKYKLM
jgi:hypothetical protein